MTSSPSTPVLLRRIYVFFIFLIRDRDTKFTAASDAVFGGLSRQIEVLEPHTVLPFRSFVCEPMRHGNLLLAGDAAHIVPPTGAQGPHSTADVAVLANVLERVILKIDSSALDEHTGRAPARVWGRHFPYWMSTMLPATPEAPRSNR